MIGLINYGSGNYTSVRNALEFLGAPVKEIKSPEDFYDVSHIILPGVGAYQTAIKRLDEMNLIELLKKNIVDKKKYFLGICVGMQILSDKGYEHGDWSGLGIIPGKVKKIDTMESKLRLPHIGWNELIFDRENPLFSGMSKNPVFYFVHSFNFECKDLSHRLAYCSYGVGVTAAVNYENIYGVQFHPEKSQVDGLQLLKNFIEL